MCVWVVARLCTSKTKFLLLLFFEQVDRNNTQLQQNATTVLTEIEEMHMRLTSVLKERTEFLKSSVDKYLIVESKTLKDLKENLELELANIKVSITLYSTHVQNICFCFKSSRISCILKLPTIRREAAVMVSICFKKSLSFFKRVYYSQVY